MTIKAGDVLLFKVDKFSFPTAIASGIRLITGNKVVHVGVVLMVGVDGAIHWTDTNPFQVMKFHKTTLEEIKGGYGALKLEGISSIPQHIYDNLKIEKEFLQAARRVYLHPHAQHYSYRTITSLMIDHGYRRFKSPDTPYKVWVKPKGFICSVLTATIIDMAIGRRYPEWTEGAELYTFEPDDFTVAPFQVNYAI